MEFLLFLLILVFAFVSSSKKGKKGKKPHARTLREQYVTFQDEVEKAFAEASQPMDGDMEEDFVPEPEPAFVQGVSLRDDEGCVGGSMAHEHTEGETHEEHSRHLEVLRQREASETLAAEAALELAEMNLKKLRRAVVMAEVLNKPVALRRRRG